MFGRAAGTDASMALMSSSTELKGFQMVCIDLVNNCEFQKYSEPEAMQQKSVITLSACFVRHMMVPDAFDIFWYCNVDSALPSVRCSPTKK